MNIEELKRLAEAATPGPWKVAEWTAGQRSCEVMTCRHHRVVSDAIWLDAAYIAAANPAAVLSLIAEIERLKDLLIKRDREYRQEMASYRLKVQSQDEATFSAQRDLLRAQKDEIEQLRDQVNGLTGTADRAEKERDELLAALKDAREMVSDWAGYASPYFQEKHDIDGDLKKLDDAIAKAEADHES